ncbi:uncharacterized protein [Dermacentor andersoni]|uniref:uncharacterized protein n=1 Tax=Dermacentor andersoni TaxID=34620 RepID=UPI003B3AD043
MRTLRAASCFCTRKVFEPFCDAIFLGRFDSPHITAPRDLSVRAEQLNTGRCTPGYGALQTILRDMDLEKMRGSLAGEAVLVYRMPAHSSYHRRDRCKCNSRAAGRRTVIRWVEHFLALLQHCFHLTEIFLQNSHRDQHRLYHIARIVPSSGVTSCAI